MTIQEFKDIVQRDREWRDTAPGYTESVVEVKVESSMTHSDVLVDDETCCCGVDNCPESYVHWTSGF